MEPRGLLRQQVHVRPARGKACHSEPLRVPANDVEALRTNRTGGTEDDYCLVLHHACFSFGLPSMMSGSSVEIVGNDRSGISMSMLSLGANRG